MTTYPYPSGCQVILPPDATEEEWHAARATGIGGSDAATICGLNKHESPRELWLEKIGTPAPRAENPDLDEAAEMGHVLEPIVASRFTKKTGLPVYPYPGMLRALDPEWALINLDGATLDGGEYGLFEAKTRSSYALQDWIDEPPAGPYLQVQHGLMVTGWEYGYVACLIGGQRTLVHRVERDDSTIEGLRRIGDEFWDMVTSRTPPPIDGSKAAADLLARLHADVNTVSVVADPTEVEDLIMRHREAKILAESAELGLGLADNRLKEIAGEAAEVWIAGELAYTWRKHHRRGDIDFSSLLEDHPDIDLDDYRGPSTPYRTLLIHLEDS